MGVFAVMMSLQPTSGFAPRTSWVAMVLLLVVLVPPADTVASAQSPPKPEEIKSPPIDPGTRRAIEEQQRKLLVERTAARLHSDGVAYLLASQEKQGGWASEHGPGISALVVKALIQSPHAGPGHEAVQRGVKFVLGFQQPDGGVYNPEGLHKTYESSVVLSMLSALGGEKYQAEIKKLQAFLKQRQWDESEDKAESDPWYGGAGYGQSKRPDLSNTQMMLQALHDSGVAGDDPAFRKALAFVQRCQMNAETNDQKFAEGSSEGGFIYSPANGGESSAGRIKIAGKEQLRCLGTMTYAGLKSMLYANVAPNDPRVTAAVQWIGRHWTLDFNPNMPAQRSKEGLYYYYHLFARTWAALGVDTITDAHGRVHPWRMELVNALRLRQQEDGSWVNPADGHMEDIPALTTAYSVLALQAAFPAPSGS
jgi:squalene-hopene/tetraprenyl-beta-curcumene cyclase